MTTLDIERLREVAEEATPGPWQVNHAARAHVWADRDAAGWDAFHVAACGDALGKEVERSRNDAAHIATFDPPTVLALLDRLDAAEAALGKVRALAEELTQEAQRQSKAHNVETAAGLWRASDLLAAALASTQREER